jgi:glycosyltransferase involved in cell wall biosynthesis
MHICFLCNEYPPGRHGGIGSMTQTLGRALAARGNVVTVIGTYPQRTASDENDCGVRVIRLPHTRVPKAGVVFNSLQLARQLQRVAYRRPIDIIEGPENALAFIPTARAGRRVIRMNGGHHYFASELRQRKRPVRVWLERRSFTRATHLCAVSGYVATRTCELLGLGSKPIAVLPNPVDTDRFVPSNPEQVVPGRIVFVGSLCEKKGIRQLLEALPSVLSAVPHASLIVYGRNTTDANTGRSYLSLLMATLSQHAIPESVVRFEGHVAQEHLPDALSEAAVCVFPSHAEAMPIAWLEALAAGKAVVGSLLGPGPEVIEHGVTGLLCNPHDPRSIARCVIQVLTDTQLRYHLGNQARASAVAQFSVDVLVQRNDDFYKHVVSG